MDIISTPGATISNVSAGPFDEPIHIIFDFVLYVPIVITSLSNPYLVIVELESLSINLVLSEIKFLFGRYALNSPFITFWPVILSVHIPEYTFFKFIDTCIEPVEIQG